MKWDCIFKSSLQTKKSKTVVHVGKKRQIWDFLFQLQLHMSFKCLLTWQNIYRAEVRTEVCCFGGFKPLVAKLVIAAWKSRFCVTSVWGKSPLTAVNITWAAGDEDSPWPTSIRSQCFTCLRLKLLLPIELEASDKCKQTCRMCQSSVSAQPHCVQSLT